MANLISCLINMKYIYFLSFLIGVFSCAPSRFVKPLEHKQHAISGSFGGPIAKISGVATLPIPFTSFGYGYGLKPKTTIYANWHTTAAVFGVFQIDAGLTQNIWINSTKKMGVSISPAFNFMVDVFEKNMRLWPQLDANYYFDYYEKEKKEHINRNHFYVGMTNWFELQKTKAHDQNQTNRIIFSPQIGHTFERGKWNYILEVKFLAPYASNQNIVLDYVSPFGKRGGMGAYFGVTFKL